LWNRMGASGLKRSICDAAADVAVTATIGAKHAPDPSDLLQSKLILIWGHNPASTNPHVMPIIRRAQRSGTRVVVIDPRRTLTARSADQHIQPNPATDGALALGLVHILFAEGFADEAWLKRYSVGWRELRERATAYPPERVAAITGLSVEHIVALARLWGTTKPAMLKFSDGVQRHANGGQTIRALLCLPAVTGQYGLPGGGVYYSQSGWIQWDASAVGHAGECPPTPREVNMNRLGAALLGETSAPPIQSLYVFNANPAAASPNAGLIAEGLQREDLFTVVHELFETDTARYADILLPATSQLEQTDLHKPYGHRHLQYNTQAIAPLGEATSNWDVMRLLAARLGYDDPWLRQSAEEAIAEVLDATRADNSLLAGITLDRLQREGTVSYSFDGQVGTPFADGHFPTPSGKVELVCAAMRDHGVDPLPEYVAPAEFTDHQAKDGWLTLLSGAAHHFVTTSLANVPTLRAKEGEPAIELNPRDAAKRAIDDGSLVEVSNARGSCHLLAKVTDAVPPGVAVAPKGHWAKNSADGRNINWLTSDALADLGGQSTFHTNAVQVRAVALRGKHARGSRRATQPEWAGKGRKMPKPLPSDG